MEEPSKGTMHMIDALPPRLAFWAGVLTSAGTIFAIGFIILAVMMFKGVDFTSNTTSKTTVSNSNSNTNAAVAAADTTGTPTGTVTADSIRNERGTGDLTIVEYSDTECPFCKRFHATMQQTLENYDGKVTWAYKHLPLTSLHPKAQKEALATECAADQGKFWEYLDLMMETTNSNNSLPDETIYTMATDLGLDTAKFTDCVDTEATKDRVAEDSAEAQKFGARGTPYSLVIDKDGNIVDVIEGALPYESVATILDSHL